jgi:hypothetical protein
MVFTTSHHEVPGRRLVLAGLLALGICSCHAPQPAPAGPAPIAAQAPAPQFTYVSWNQVKPLIRAGRIVQTVSGRGGLSLILDNHNWLHLVAKPGDPLPKNPMDFIYRNAPNAGAIRYTKE